jgi:hypothetical protein
MEKDVMNVALALGLGLAAGAVGTVVLTVSETVEQRLTQRKTSTVPGRRGLVGQGRRRGGRGTVEHTGALDPRHHLGRRPGSFGTDRSGAVAATAVHYAAVWGGDVLLYRTLGNRRPIRPGVSGRGSLTDAARRAFLSSPPTASTSRS